MQGFRPRSESAPENLLGLASQRKGIAVKDVQHSTLINKLRELKESKEFMTETIEQAKSSLETMKAQISEMNQEHARLIERREKKRSTKKWLFNQKPSGSGEDLLQLDQLILDIWKSDRAFDQGNQ